MDRLAIIEEQRNVETTGRFPHSKKRRKLWIDCLQYKDEKLLKHRLNFSFKEKIETMVRKGKINVETIERKYGRVRGFRSLLRQKLFDTSATLLCK